MSNRNMISELEFENENYNEDTEIKNSVINEGLNTTIFVPKWVKFVGISSLIASNDLSSENTIIEPRIREPVIEEIAVGKITKEFVTDEPIVEEVVEKTVIEEIAEEPIIEDDIEEPVVEETIEEVIQKQIIIETNSPHTQDGFFVPFVVAELDKRYVNSTPKPVIITNNTVEKKQTIIEQPTYKPEQICETKNDEYLREVQEYVVEKPKIVEPGTIQVDEFIIPFVVAELDKKYFVTTPKPIEVITTKPIGNVIEIEEKKDIVNPQEEPTKIEELVTGKEKIEVEIEKEVYIPNYETQDNEDESLYMVEEYDFVINDELYEEQGTNKFFVPFVVSELNKKYDETTKQTNSTFFEQNELINIAKKDTMINKQNINIESSKNINEETIDDNTEINDAKKLVNEIDKEVEKTKKNNESLSAKQKSKLEYKSLSKDERRELKARAKKIENLNKPHSGPKNVVMTNNNNIIELTNVVKYYTNGYIVTKILKGVNLTIPQGSFVIILGPSGSGKTTLMNILSGLDRASEGKVYVAGKDLITLNHKELTKFRKDNVGYVFQQYGLIPNLTVRENIEIGADLQEDKSKRLDVDDLLDAVGMSTYANKFPHQLSGGQQQRVSIARAFAKNPKILFGDEPTGAIDEEMSKIVLKQFVSINKRYGTTVIMVTHNPIFQGLGDIVIKVKDGIVSQIIHNKNPKSVDELPWGME